MNGKKDAIVLTVLWGLIMLGFTSMVGSFLMIYLDKDVPEGLSITVVAAVIGALGAILSRTGHQDDTPAGTPSDPITTTVNQPDSDPIPVTDK